MWLTLRGTRGRAEFPAFRALALIQRRNPIFRLSWTLFHPIDAQVRCAGSPAATSMPWRRYSC